jgi:hypothetical protein
MRIGQDFHLDYERGRTYGRVDGRRGAGRRREGPMAKISEFLTTLAADEDLQKEWVKNKTGTAKKKGLSDPQATTVASGDTAQIESAIQKEDKTTAKVYLWIKKF